MRTGRVAQLVYVQMTQHHDYPTSKWRLARLMIVISGATTAGQYLHYAMLGHLIPPWRVHGQGVSL